MNKLVLIDGFPNNGKTHLAERILAADYGYRVIGTDVIYFEFIRDRQPDLFFPLFNQPSQHGGQELSAAEPIGA